ncbi:MAG: integrase, partial [Paraclostridium sp.]
PRDMRNDLLEILSMKNDLKEVIQAFREGYAKEPTKVIEIIEDKGIKISLPDDEVVRTTVRANKTVLDTWNEFCSRNKEFSKQDLISMAMLEYIEKYK